MTKERIVKIFKDTDILIDISEIESLAEAIRNICDEASTELLLEEPHAINSSERYIQAGRTIEEILLP